ncbi:sulfite exporter TauE/SafE family protein [Bacillus cereus group sp. BfR-BA-01518]|uniref:sulfite exporter TauE/SafE family protein n=1 Tax=Bacillus cereus group sp. BfR-BA-01518 TaxID=2920368 RepID=UPI001F5AB229|nr:sulfite exporter TauE/SafE family protein [Bacillus cereus group sp. BfR-BA-01518]
MSINITIMGFLIGCLVGMTGVGGAALLTPILILLGINPIIAVGTDLVYNSITKLFGTIQHFRNKTINYQLVIYLAIGSVPSATMAIVFLNLLNNTYEIKDQIIKNSLGYVLIVVALATLFKTFFYSEKHTKNLKDKSIVEKRVLTIIIGAILGFIVGLTSIGSGSLFALAMMFLYRLNTAELVGTDIAHAFVLVTVAGILNAGIGNVDYWLVANLLLGSVPGVLIGSNLSIKFPDKPLRVFVSFIILISGIKLI